MRVSAVVGLIGIAGILSGCNSLPADGPYSWDVRAHNRIEGEIDYTLVPVTDNVISVLLANEIPDLKGAFTDRRAATEIKFGVGDIVSVRIFEAAAGGLFIPNDAGARSGNFVDLPDQPVDKNGNIQVPYAGPVKAVDQTPQQVQETINGRLRNRAIDPQAIVSLKDQRTSLVSIIGEVNAPTRIPVTAAGDKVLDAISRAGGPKFPGHETYVTLQREGKKGTISFLRLINSPANNVFVRGNDTVFVYREPHTFVALGAFGTSGLNTNPTQGQINFDKEKLTMVEALGKAFGLNDLSSDPASVFLYRLESRKVAAALGIDVSVEPKNIPIYTKAPMTYQGEPYPTTETDEGKYPVIYNINFRDPTGFFHATRFQMRNNDVLYAANASTVETTKLLSFLRIFIATVREGNAGVQELKCKGLAGC